MYLKSIEAYGFKSFANKIEFNFHDGITGIVGPNGSGKSNVADALRWVLGEQSVKMLRGSNMQDVIFSGTENRKPLSYAQVAVTLDNSDKVLPIDYSEITVTRKLYRSGESEYLINNTPCRLKDINELFYDTGIGKEGYSIIGQGQIDKILSGRPEDRRELFDEAAGIVKYKRRKLFTEKKLENERNNLVRVNDILDELKSRLEPLKNESIQAKKYLDLKDELKNLDINVFLNDIEKILSDKNEIDTKIEYVDNEINKNDLELKNINKEFEEVEKYIDTLNTTIEENKDKLSKSNILKNQLENQIELLKEQINSSINLSEQNTKRKEELTKSLDDKSSELKELANKKSDLEKNIETFNNKKNEYNNKSNELKEEIENISKSIENINKNILEVLNERIKTSANIEKYDTLLEQKKIDKSNINNSLISIKSEEEKLNIELKESREKHRSITEKIDNKNKDIINTNSDIEVLQKNIHEKRINLNDYRQELERTKTRLEAIKDITERYEGYGGSVRHIMELKKENKGIIGVVGDIIRVDKDHEIAIEIALSANIQNIVVDNEKTAKDLINILKENKAGRGTFIPLTLSKYDKEFRYKEVLNEENVIGIASDIVKCEDKYINIVKNLLGGIVVVKTIDDGIRISKKYTNLFKIVTLDGEFFNTKGGISGGAYKNNNNLLGRNRQIKEFEKLVKASQLKVENAIEDVEKTKEVRLKKYKELEKFSDELNLLKIDENNININIDSINSKINDISLNLDEIKNKSIEVDRSIEELNSFKLEINNDLEKSIVIENESRNKIKELENLLNKKNNERNNLNSIIEENNIKHSTLSNEIEFISNNIQRVKDEIKEVNLKLDSLNESHKMSNAEIEEKENSIKEITQIINESVGEFKKLEIEIKNKENEKNDLNNKYKSFITKKDEINKIFNELEKEKIRLDNNKNKLQDLFDVKVNYMWDEYEISIDNAKELKDDKIIDISIMKSRISELRKEIKSLGDINVNSIEEYINVKNRHDFLQKQHDDLIESEVTLLDIIKELDKNMKEQFANKFAQINKEYNKVFKDLFGGGKGTLELIDETDLLETGIKITAQPPGKKLQNIMQLSGGEKALTAISLLFAIQNLKPSPFCMLDEIEAALDDINVVRFAKYLSNMTKNTQFIVITHRRGTMRAADRLYGITMQEKGVSTLVSVNLVEKKLN